MADRDMGEFWNQRARENPHFFVDNRLDYRDPNVEAFWADGPGTVDTVLDAAGASFEPSDVVVEIGCGLGRLTRVIADRAARVVAFDVSSEMIELAREANAGLDNVEWVTGDGRSLAAVGDSEADACFSHVVFQHIPDVTVTMAYVAEMGRVLREGGWAAFHVSNDPTVHRPRSGLRGAVATALGRGPKGQSDAPWLGSAVDLDELRRVAEGAGMDVERVEGEGTQWCVVLTRKRGA